MSDELREAAEYAEAAIRYVREPHHLDHGDECSLCPLAMDTLDGALAKLSASLEGESK